MLLYHTLEKKDPKKKLTQIYKSLPHSFLQATDSVDCLRTYHFIYNSHAQKPERHNEHMAESFEDIPLKLGQTSEGKQDTPQPPTDNTDDFSHRTWKQSPIEQKTARKTYSLRRRLKHWGDESITVYLWELT